MKSIFDEHWEKYEAWYGKNRFAYLSELEAIKTVLPREGKGVEIGVGSGRFAVPLGIALGVEPSVPMADLAYIRGIDVIESVAEALPLDNNSFDYVLMVTTVCFLDDIEKAFREVHRVLRKKGTFIIGFVDKHSPLGELYQQQKNDSVFYNAATFYSTEDVLAYLKQTNFSHFVFMQTLFQPLEHITDIEPITSGYGEGSFVVIKAKKV